MAIHQKKLNLLDFLHLFTTFITSIAYDVSSQSDLMNITITYIKAEKYYNDFSHTYSILFESIVPELQYIIPPHAVATVPPAIITTRVICLGGRKNFRHLGKFCELNLGVIFVKVWLLRKFDPYE